MNHPNQPHCWFTEQQSKHTWCHLCGQHKSAREAEDDTFERARRAIRARDTADAAKTAWNRATKRPRAREVASIVAAIYAARPVVNVTSVTRIQPSTPDPDRPRG